MKRIIFTIATLALMVAVSSCDRNNGQEIITDDGVKSIVLSIDFMQSGVKSTVDDNLDAPWNDGKDMTQFDIYFTGSDNVIRYAYRANAQASGDGATIWDGLIDKGVRFVGMEGVSRVFVVANGPDITGLALSAETPYLGPQEGSMDTYTVESILLELQNYAASAEQNAMAYIGADLQIEPLSTQVDNTTGEVVVDDEQTGGRYYSADITIRPAVSRVEISQISVETAGTVYLKADAEGTLSQCDQAEATYVVSYSGFDATLTGVYMSNFYRDAKLIPVPSDLTAWNLFETPTFVNGVSPIQAGAWTALSGDPVEPFSKYSNYEGTAYGELVGSDYQHVDGNIKYLFDGTLNVGGAGTEVMAFNFFYPYDITVTTGAGQDVASPVAETASPKFHFQFIPGANKNIQITAQRRTDVSSPWTDINDPDMLDLLRGMFEWPYTPDAQGVAYANVVSFYEDEALQNEVGIQTGKIYKVRNVKVTPNLLTVDTEATDAQNVIVTVTVVPFGVENVYPGFDN